MAILCSGAANLVPATQCAPPGAGQTVLTAYVVCAATRSRTFTAGARKHLLFIGDAEANNPRRLFIKGHFLCAAEALERHYPDAVFLTLVRDPVSRLQSGINYLWVNPSDPAMGPPPWAWLSQSLLQTESDYCRIEQAWFSQENGARRCVVRFAEFVSDLEGTMQHVYRTCFDQEQLPLHVPHTHPSRERKRYTVNRSLAELSIDADRMRTELADYVAWCQPEKPQEVLSRPI